MLTISTIFNEMLCGANDTDAEKALYKCVSATNTDSFNVRTNPFPMETDILRIPRDAAVDLIESLHPNDFGLLYSLYGEYNSFGIIGTAANPEYILCWFSRDT